MGGLVGGPIAIVIDSMLPMIALIDIFFNCVGRGGTDAGVGIVNKSF